MKKLILIAALLLGGIASKVQAGPASWEYTHSSFTNVATAGPIMFTSHTIQWVGVGISSGVPGSFVSFFRSTGPTFTPDLSTMTIIRTETSPLVAHMEFVELPEIRNSSYTFINKVGTAELTYFYKCIGVSDIGRCPGINSMTGQNQR